MSVESGLPNWLFFAWRAIAPFEAILRPSSHSEDGTIVAIFDSGDQAESCAKRLARVLKRASCSAFGNKVKVECLNCEHGTLCRAKRILKRGGAKRIKEVDSYQELVISVVLPRGMTVATAPLVLDRDVADILRFLYLKCPPPSREEREDCVILTFVYAGEAIYTRFKRGGTPVEELWISNTESRLVPGNFRITGLI